jgi:hypothetical protein
MTVDLTDPDTIARLVQFQDAFANPHVARMLAADLFQHGRAAAYVRLDADGVLRRIEPTDVTTLRITRDHDGNIGYDQVIAGFRTASFSGCDILYLTVAE